MTSMFFGDLCSFKRVSLTLHCVFTEVMPIKMYHVAVVPPVDTMSSNVFMVLCEVGH